MTLVTIAIMFAGYQNLWYGWCTIQGPKGDLPAPGFMDLLKPSQLSKCQTWYSARKTKSSSGSSQGGGFNGSKDTSPGGTAPITKSGSKGDPRTFTHL